MAYINLIYNKRSIAILGGHFVECFDNTLYGFFAVLLSSVFFPPISVDSQILASFGAFAVGFVARPLGALIFGLIGDTQGRQKSIIYSMALVSIPTIMIGLIPSYYSLGILSPILLIICRLLQGICIGGEFTGINIYNTENNNYDGLGKKTGILIGIGVMGAVSAAILGAVFSMDIMPCWAWRVPFISGGCLAIVISLLRRNIPETESFTNIANNKKILSNPWKEILTNHKMSSFLAVTISGLTVMPLYCTTILANHMFKELGYSTSQSLLLNTFSMIIDAMFIMVYGRMADYFGFHRQILFGVLLTSIMVFPAFYFISGTVVTIYDVFAFILILVSVGGIINGCAMPYMAGFFPINCRYSALAFSVTVGHALLGGTTPLVCSYLQIITGTRFAAAFWLFFVAITAATGIFLFKYQFRADTNRIAASV